MTLTLLVLASLAAAPVDRSEQKAKGDEGPPMDLIWMAGPVDATPSQPRPANTARLRALGAKLYRERCAACHGARGDGRGARMPVLAVPPRDFTKGVYKVRSTPSGTLPTDDDLFVVLTRGMHGTPMMPWSPLSEEQRWALVGRIKSFSPRFRDEKPGEPFKTPAPPIEDSTLREKGKRLYALHRCGACHGETGAANGPAGAFYAQEPRERAVRIRDFTRGRFVRGMELADLFLTLRTGLDGTPMGPYDALGDEDLWALAAHVRTLVRERPLAEWPQGDRAE